MLTKQVDCRIQISEMKSCSQDRSRIEVDAEYCEAVDYRGRPIGEYGEDFHFPAFHLFVFSAETGVDIHMAFVHTHARTHMHLEWM